MTEVPDHLLQRSAARRAALGLGGGGDAPAAAAPSAAVEAAGDAAPAPAAAAAATPAPVEAAPKAPEPLPPYVEASVRRKRVPMWAMPVLAFLPVWAWLYVQTLAVPDHGGAGQLALGAEVYAASGCAGCHGGGGGGGTGRPLSNGEVLLTFPTIEGMIEFVAIGSAGVGIGNPYGDPDRPGGPHVSGGIGANMPPFYDVLTPEELLSVVRHEREALGGETVDPARLGPDGELLHENGTPYLVDGELVDADGNPLLDETGRLASGGGEGG